MRTGLVTTLLFLAGLSQAAGAEWKPVERVETYSISGTTGIALYRSIGQRGPKVGPVRAIAYTDFRLTWKRDYQPRGGGCTLASARPNLTIIYRLPKPAERLPAATQRLWDTFIDGVRRHERGHGDIIIDMVKKIEAVSVGLSADNDPGCRKVRRKLQEFLPAIVEEQKRRNRAFDREEMSDGGTVRRLVFGLVNGG